MPVMSSKADIEQPISIVEPAHAKSVQAILDRAHREEQSVNTALTRTVGGALSPPRGKGLLSKTLGLALSHHGRTKKGGPSLRPVAPDTNGRAFHFSHSTVNRSTASSGQGSRKAGGSGNAAEPNEGSGGRSSGGTQTTANGTTSSSTGRAQPDLGSKEAGHQRYVERDAALARDAAEEFGIVVGADRQTSMSSQREATEGMEPSRSARSEKTKDTEEEKAAGKAEERARPIEVDIEALKREIAKTARGRRTQSAEAAQAYMEDPTKVAPQVRHGHSNSFGTVGETFEERVAFWNDVQKHEREKDARTQIRLVLELPHEATPAARQEIVKRFCEKYEQLGVPYWASIHAPTQKNDDRNHHAHIVHGIRPARQMIDPTTGERAWDFTITETYKTSTRHKRQRHPFRQNAVKEFRDRDYVRDTRRRFAETANQVLEKAGCPIRYDARSYKDMGLDIEPLTHIDRILADRSKTHDFVVMDPEWTRRMIEQEMRAAAVERDKTYVELKKVEKRLAEVSRSITRLTDANAKLPKKMRLSPLSRMTVTTAKMITRRMLVIEQARIEQRFADEATARTIQHVIDATAPTSGHRGGEERRAKPMDGANAPDALAMAHLHKAAIEELRLHRIATAGRLRSLGLQAAAVYEQWRAEADPPLQAGAPPQEARAQPMPGTAPHPLPPQAEPARATPAMHPQPTPKAANPSRMPSPAMSPTETVIAMNPNASERLRQEIANTMARMQASTQALLQATNGPEELAEAVKAMIAHIPPAARETSVQPAKRTEQATAVGRAETQPITNGATAPTEWIDPEERRPAATQAQPLAAIAPATRTAEPMAQPANHRSAAEHVWRQPGYAAPRRPTPPISSNTRTAAESPGKTPIGGTGRPAHAKLTASKGATLALAPSSIGQPPPPTKITAFARRTEADGPSKQAEGLTTPTVGTEPNSAAQAGKAPPTTAAGAALMHPAEQRTLGPDDFLPKRPVRKLQRSAVPPSKHLQISVLSSLAIEAKRREAQASQETPDRQPEIKSEVTKENILPTQKERKKKLKLVIVRSQDYSIG